MVNLPREYTSTSHSESLFGPSVVIIPTYLPVVNGD